MGWFSKKKEEDVESEEKTSEEESTEQEDGEESAERQALTLDDLTGDDDNDADLVEAFSLLEKNGFHLQTYSEGRAVFKKD